MGVRPIIRNRTHAESFSRYSEPRTVVLWAGFVEIISASFDRINKMMRRGNIQDRTLLCVLLNWSHFPPSFQA